LTRVKAPGPLLASGRDAEIFEYGPGLVLRRARRRRSMAQEARTMVYLRDQGFPVPAVEQLSDDGTDLVMERIDGPSMVGALARQPWTIRRQARTLAELHLELHGIAPPDFLPRAPVGSGDRVVHMDLHPLNVIIGPTGPVVIDWTNAGIGDANVDVDLAWVLMAAGQIPGNRAAAVLLGQFRALLVNGFLSHFDRAELVAQLRDTVTWKVQDLNMSVAEVAEMWTIVEREESRH
jgi:aminoglycoside phosphotransferase (APT) family kinase protein